MPMTGVLSPVFTTRDKKQADPFAREKVRILSKFVLNSLSLPLSVRRGSFLSQKAISIKAWN